MQFEVEQKFPLTDVIATQRRLRDLGACESGTIEQVDTYFNHPGRDFAQTDEALRLRRVGQANFVTYKGPKLDQTTKTRREIELPLGDGDETAAGFAEMLIALGFRRVADVRKTRLKFDLDWQGHSVEAAVDNVAGLGEFLELEIAADENQLDAAKAAIAALAKSLKLADSERRSYLELLLESRP